MNRMQMRQQWQDKITTIAKELGRLLISQQIFNETVAIMFKDKKLLSPPIFLNWLTTNYVDTVGAGIRRLADPYRKKKYNTLSLCLLLNEVKEKHTIITRTEWVAEYPNFMPRDGEDSPNEEFNKFAAKDCEYIDVRLLENDIQKIKKITDPIMYYVDKWIAHQDLNRDPKKAPYIKKFGDVLTFLGPIVCKYHLLLAGSDLSGTCKPVFNENWKSPLKYAWIKGKQKQ